MRAGGHLMLGALLAATSAWADTLRVSAPEGCSFEALAGAL